MHPFYDANADAMQHQRPPVAGLASMLAYLAFWAVALVVARRYLDRRFPETAANSETRDRAIGLLRERYARGEIGDEEFRLIRSRLREDLG